MVELLLTILIGLNIALIIIILKRKENNTINYEKQFSMLEKNDDRIENLIRLEMLNNRQELNLSSKQQREELVVTLNSLNETIMSNISRLSVMQKNQLDTFSNQLSNLTQINEHKLDNMRETVEERLKTLQQDNNIKLEQMRSTVDEKLNATLEHRLGESFKLVSDRLELVYRGLGEMKNLASGVGDLKKVLTNVKTRGTWGEIQLENLLEQIMTKDQYDKNVVAKKGSNERVEFAIRIPSKDKEASTILLPIDSKFPLEDYQRLLQAQDNGEFELAEQAYKNIEIRIKSEAKDIKEKYIDPPNTTDFGIMFLPIEGLYAEVLRRPGLTDILQRDYRVIVTGPTTITALLNSLQMGFRTLAIEKRSSEVWELLGAVKTEFGKFGDILDKTQKKLQEASNTIETAAKKSRNIERKLKRVQEVPINRSTELLSEVEEEE